MNPHWHGLLFVSASLENVVPPVPGDTVVVFSAYLVGRGIWDIAPVFATTVSGGVLGFMFMFSWVCAMVGRYLKGARAGFTSEGLQRAEGWLTRYGFGLFWLIAF